MPLIRFEDSDYPPLELPEGAELSRCLNASNGPLLFGCRTGICGTCLVEVSPHQGPAEPDEQEVLELYAPGNPRVRLGCQLRVRGELSLRPLKPT